MTRHHSCRVSPFGHPRINARLAAPRGISQPPTSFIGSQCQGIHHAPLNTYNTKPKNESPNPERLGSIRNLHYMKQQPAQGNPPPKEGQDLIQAIISMLATTIHESNTTPHHQSRATTRSTTPTGDGRPQRVAGPVVSKPNSVSGNFLHRRFSHAGSTFVVAPDPHPLQVKGHPTNRSDHRTPTRCGRA